MYIIHDYYNPHWPAPKGPYHLYVRSLVEFVDYIHSIRMMDYVFQYEYPTPIVKHRLRDEYWIGHLPNGVGPRGRDALDIRPLFVDDFLASNAGRLEFCIADTPLPEDRHLWSFHGEQLVLSQHEGTRFRLEPGDFDYIGGIDKELEHAIGIIR